MHKQFAILSVMTKRKLVSFLTIIGLIILAGVVFLKANSGTEQQVKILDYGLSTCTEDVPSSSCGPYEVNAQFANGNRVKYKVAGYDNHDSEQYDGITSLLVRAKEQQSYVKVRVNDDGVILSVH